MQLHKWFYKNIDRREEWPMAFDGAFLKLMIGELEPLIVGARVDKIFQPSKTVLF